MPNLRAQIVGPLGAKAPSGLAGDDVGIWMQASNGNEVVVTKRQLRSQFQAATGSRAAKRAAAIAWLKQTLRDGLGADMIDVANIATDFDDTDGTPTQLQVT